METDGEDTDPGVWVDGVTVGGMEVDMEDMGADMVVVMEDLAERGMGKIFV